MRHARIVALGLLVLISGCSGERNPRELLGPSGAGTIVVDARLIVGQPLSFIRLRTTQAPNRPYNEGDARLSGVSITVFTAGDDSIRYAEYAGGDYLPFDTYGGISDTVQPATTYHFRAVAPDGRVVTAQTTTPQPFHVNEWRLVDGSTFAERRRLATFSDFEDPDSVFAVESNQLVYQDGLVEARFDRGAAIALQMGLINLETGSPLLIDADFVDEDTVFEREISSPPFDAPDGFVRLPWFAVFYEGRHLFRVFSVDRNWYDLARTARFFGPASGGFGGTAGDEFERPVFHIEGGIGLFGSAAMDETGFTVHPRP